MKLYKGPHDFPRIAEWFYQKFCFVGSSLENTINDGHMNEKLLGGASLVIIVIVACNILRIILGLNNWSCQYYASETRFDYIRLSKIVWTLWIVLRMFLFFVIAVNLYYFLATALFATAFCIISLVYMANRDSWSKTFMSYREHFEAVQNIYIKYSRNNESIKREFETFRSNQIL